MILVTPYYKNGANKKNVQNYWVFGHCCYVAKMDFFQEEAKTNREEEEEMKIKLRTKINSFQEELRTNQKKRRRQTTPERNEGRNEINEKPLKKRLEAKLDAHPEKPG